MRRITLGRAAILAAALQAVVLAPAKELKPGDELKRDDYLAPKGCKELPETLIVAEVFDRNVTLRDNSDSTYFGPRSATGVTLETGGLGNTPFSHVEYRPKATSLV